MGKKRNVGSSSTNDDGGKVSVTLPKLCQWFADDFGDRDGDRDGSPSDVLKSLEPYLSRDQRRSLKSCWNEKKNCYDLKSVKYRSFVFECRFLTLKKDDE